jgi:hypothetical protein
MNPILSRAVIFAVLIAALLVRSVVRLRRAPRNATYDYGVGSDGGSGASSMYPRVPSGRMGPGPNPR